MLGRLAKWLRVLGYDCAYERKIDDDALIARAWREGRVLLTRDNALVGRRALRRNGGEFVLVESDRPEDQLAQVMRERKLAFVRGRLLTRCLRCNEPIVSVDRDAVKDLVPAYVFKTQERFSRCPACRRVYWRATHVAGIVERLLKRLASADLGPGKPT